MSEEDKKNAALADEHSENTEQGQPAEPGKLNHYSGRSEDAVRATPEEMLIEKAGRESEEHAQAGNGGSHSNVAVAVGPGSHAHGHAHAHDAVRPEQSNAGGRVVGHRVGHVRCRVR